VSTAPLLQGYIWQTIVPCAWIATNEVQPDALLRLSPTAGGHSRVSADDYIDGAPELIVEVASSSASYDMHDKLKVYRRNGVQEYLVWLIHEQKFVWFSLDEGEYTLLLPDEQGVIHSRVFPGLRLAVDALIGRHLTAV
jgi:Uma2 family endonuclease